MMSATPPDEPEFLCERCKGVLCEDCASIAAEYEFLYQRHSHELQRAHEETEIIRQELERTRRDARMWEEISKVGFTAVIQAWMDDEVAKAKRAGRESMRRELEASGFLKKLRKAERMIRNAKRV